jgi:hypothetical protein
LDEEDFCKGLVYTNGGVGLQQRKQNSQVMNQKELIKSAQE